jgi:hypothetical protein
METPATAYGRDRRPVRAARGVAAAVPVRAADAESARTKAV